jgi:hypothetical protein
VAILAGLAVVVKVVPITAAARLLGQRPASAAAAGFLLAQIGEFSFVLQRVGAEAGLSVAGQGADGDQAFIATTVVLIAVATGLLGAVHRGVRLADQVIEIRGVHTRERHGSEADGDPHLATGLEHNDRFHDLSHSLTDGAQVGFPRSGKYGEELLAPVPHQRVTFAQDALHVLGDRLQHSVAHLVAVGVIDCLEVVDVEQHDPQRLVRAHRTAELLAKSIQPEATVVQPG